MDRCGEQSGLRGHERGATRRCGRLRRFSRQWSLCGEKEAANVQPMEIDAPVRILLTPNPIVSWSR